MPNGISVDQLNIEISATSKSASREIDDLCIGLNRLSSTIGRINTEKITELSNRFQGLSKGFNAINIGNSSKQIASMNRSFINLGKIDDSGISRIKKNVNQLAESLKAFEGISFADDLSKIAGFNRSISGLGGKAALQAVENIPKLANAMKELMKTLSTAPKVSQNIIDMTNALAKLAKTGSASGKAVSSLTGVMGKFGKIGNPFKGLTRRLLAFVSIWEAIQWGKKSIEIASSLTEVQNVVDVTFGKQRDLIEEMSKTSITDFGMSELTVKEVSSRFQAMGSAMGIANKQVASSSEFLEKKGVTAYGKLGDSMGNVSVNLTKLAADMASFYNVEQKDVAEDLESIFTGASRPLREYGLDLTQATLKEFALKNGLDANIKSMSQAEKTMLRYQYVMANTGAAQGDFSKTALTWSNQIRILRQNFEQLGSIFGGVLINAFKPVVIALNNVIGKFIEFAKVVSESLGKIFGWTYNAGDVGGGVTSDLETGADAAEGISDGMGGAANNAKKLRQQLQGFDELNVLSSDKGSGGSGGSSGGAGGGSGASGTGGEWVQTESIFKGYESTLDSLYKLGDYIGTTLTKALNNIDWNSVYEGARNFGSGLANFLNGLISPDLFGALGKTLANSLNTAWEAMNSFGETFDWSDFGKSIVTGFTNFWKNFDFGLRAETFSTFVRGILQALKGAFEAISDQKTFREIGQKLVDFICGIDWEGLLWDLGEFGIALFKGVIDGLTDFSKGMADAVKKKMAPVWKSVEQWWKDNVKFKKIEAPSIGDIKAKVQKAWTKARNYWKSKTALSAISVKITSIKDKLKDAWTKAKNWWSKNVKLSIPKLTLKVEYKTPSGTIQKAVAKALSLKGWPTLRFYASGGFPEDGWFRANHGELMGKFDNGRTVVANNKQITQGIAEAVYQGNRENNSLMRQELELMRRQNELLIDLVEKETGISARDIFNTVRKEAENYKRATGRTAFAL